MAKKWTNENLPGALHYVTGNVVDRNRIFEVEANCIAFLEELQTLRSKNCKLIAFVLMPDHFHITLNPKDGDIQTTIGELKEFSAKKISQGRGQIWQESFKALPLWSPWMIKQKHNYIHSNPVLAGLVSVRRTINGVAFARSTSKNQTRFCRLIRNGGGRMM